MFCNTCGGTLNLLGLLGNRVHFNCQNCGLEESFDKEQVEDLYENAQDVLFNDDNNGVK
jgi:hypothetical protein